MKGLSQRLSNLVIFMDLISIEGHTMTVAHFVLFIPVSLL